MRAVRFPNDAGMDDEKKFSPSSRICKEDKSLKASGMKPEREFPRQSNSAVVFRVSGNTEC